MSDIHDKNIFILYDTNDKKRIILTNWGYIDEKNPSLSSKFINLPFDNEPDIMNEKLTIIVKQIATQSSKIEEKITEIKSDLDKIKESHTKPLKIERKIRVVSGNKNKPVSKASVIYDIILGKENNYIQKEVAKKTDKNGIVEIKEILPNTQIKVSAKKIFFKQVEKYFIIHNEITTYEVKLKWNLKFLWFLIPIILLLFILMFSSPSNNNNNTLKADSLILQKTDSILKKYIDSCCCKKTDNNKIYDPDDNNFDFDSSLVSDDIYNPEMPNAPYNPDNPYYVDNPNNPYYPKNPDNPYKDEIHDHDNAYNPDSPKNPYNPENPDYDPEKNKDLETDSLKLLDPYNPHSPLNPYHPKNPDYNPENPKNPYNPKNPDNPYTNPDNSYNPDNKDNPFNPENPNNPIVGDETNDSIPDLPKENRNNENVNKDKINEEIEKKPKQEKNNDKINPRYYPCETVFKSGGNQVCVFNVDLGQDCGYFTLWYDMFELKDAINIVCNGKVIFDSGYTKGKKFEKIPFNNHIITVTIKGHSGEEATKWECKIFCPVEKCN